MKLTKKKLDKLEVLIDLLDDMTCLDSTTLNDLAQAIRTANRELKSDLLHNVSKCPCCKSESFAIDKLYNKCKDCYHIWQARDVC